MFKEFEDLRALEQVSLKGLRMLFKSERYSEKIKLLCTVPGVGFLSAVQFLTEIGDMKRFKTFDQLCFYVGLVPQTNNSGDKIRASQRTTWGNVRIRTALIESAWVAIRQDPELALAYANLKKQMDAKHAIIKIARKVT